MKVWTDLFSGDEMVSDSYPHKITYEEACLEVKSRLVTKGAEDFGIADNSEDGAGAESGGETVIDVVDGCRLKEVTLDKKTWMGYIKVYLKRVKSHLEENGKAERVPIFMK